MKKSKWILNLTLSIVTMMLAAEVLAKGGGTPGAPAGMGVGVINEVRVKGVRFNSRFRADMRHRIQFNRMRDMQNMSFNEFRKEKIEQRKQQCIDTCKENLGEFYEWAGKLGWIGVGGILTDVGQSMLENKTKRQLKRKGLRMIHDPDPRKYKTGRALLSWSNIIKGFGKISFKVGALATLSYGAMNAYCHGYKCGRGRG